MTKYEYPNPSPTRGVPNAGGPAMTTFTDAAAAVDELEFLTNETGRPHAIVPVTRASVDRWHIKPASSVKRKSKILVLCEPEVTA